MTRKRKPPVPTERAEQAALFQWLRAAAPDGLFYSATAGGDGRATRTPGYRAGLPDVVLIWRGRTIWIEMKRQRGGVTSADQVAAHRDITIAGGAVCVARGWIDAARLIFGAIPMKGTSP